MPCETKHWRTCSVRAVAPVPGPPNHNRYSRNLADLQDQILSKAIVISFDRWHAGFIGCYGNPWVDTPHLDELAVRGTVFDQHFAEDLRSGSTNHAWWTGRSQFPLDLTDQQREPRWLNWLTQRGIETGMIRDPAATLPIPENQFASSVAVSLDDVPALDFEEDIPRFIRQAATRVRSMEQTPESSELLWIHAGGLPVDQGSAAFEELYGTDEPDLPAGDVDATETEELPDFPRFWRRKRSSPRELADAQLPGAAWQFEGNVQTQVDWRLRRDMYSGQVTQWDTWLGHVFEAVSKLRKHSPVLLIFTAAAGEHLGEHAAIDDKADLFEERIHVPLIVELPADQECTGRRHPLTQDVDLPATLLDWFGIPVPESVQLDGCSLLPVLRDDQPVPRDALFVSDGAGAGVRTDEYYYRRILTPTNPSTDEMIFIKPDDHWDADNLIRQLVEQADDLSGNWHACVERIRNRSKQAQDRGA